MKILVSGRGGRILWSYAVAAEIEQFEVQQHGKGLSLVARLATSDVFKLRQSPLVFEMHGTRWTWPIASALEITDGLVTAQLQPMTKR